MVKKVYKQETSFSDVFVKETGKYKKYKDYLRDYFNIVGKDDYLADLLVKIKTGKGLSGVEIERLDDLMANVSLEELLVDALLTGDDLELSDDDANALLSEDNNKVKGKPTDPAILTAEQLRIKSKIQAVTAHADRLSGWDLKFVKGDSGTALMDQFEGRKWLSDKQLKQLERIAKILRV